MSVAAVDQNVKVAVDNCIFTVDSGRLQVLLIQMRKTLFDGLWALPGGLIGTDETLDGAAARILEEQTGVRRVYLEQLYTFDATARDPSGRVLSAAYLSLIPPTGLELRTTEKYRDVRFWDCAELPRDSDFAYDHRDILEYARQRLRLKVQYTNLMWSLLPTRFTLSQLQSAYESVLERALDKRNFRRKILALGLVRASGEKSRGGRHRPAMLYSFDSTRPELVDVL